MRRPAPVAIRAQGFVPQEPIDAYYFPELTSIVTGDLSRLSFTDHAAYLSHEEDKGFLFLPSFVLADLPLLLNESVVAHELGHAVIHQGVSFEVLEFTLGASARCSSSLSASPA